MTSLPDIPHPSENLGPRKRRAPIDDNGEPVNVLSQKKRKEAIIKLPPIATKPTGSVTAKATKRTLLSKTVGVPKKLPHSQQRRKQTPLIDVEDVPDEDNNIRSTPPHNPNHTPDPMDIESRGPAPPVIDVDVDKSEASETEEESDEAELGM